MNSYKRFKKNTFFSYVILDPLCWHDALMSGTIIREPTANYQMHNLHDDLFSLGNG